MWSQGCGPVGVPRGEPSLVARTLNPHSSGPVPFARDTNDHAACTVSTTLPVLSSLSHANVESHNCTRLTAGPDSAHLPPLRHPTIFILRRGCTGPRLGPRAGAQGAPVRYLDSASPLAMRKSRHQFIFIIIIFFLIKKYIYIFVFFFFD